MISGEFAELAANVLDIEVLSNDSDDYGLLILYMICSTKLLYNESIIDDEVESEIEKFEPEAPEPKEPRSSTSSHGRLKCIKMKDFLQNNNEAP